MTDYMKIGRNIKRYRHWNELTQEQLAELIGVSTSFVGHIERGTRKIRCQ
jgi:DNA-binding XRE family transcriptional regulator